MIFEQPKRRVTRVFLHCSAWDDPMVGKDLVAEIRRWHRERGWNDIGYHFVVDRLGEVMTGRDLEKTPAAQYGHNRGTIAICVHGLTFPDKWHLGAQAGAVVSLAGTINTAFHGIVGWWGHNEVSDKACPVFDHKALLQLDRWRRMP